MVTVCWGHAGRTWSLPVGDMQVEHGHCLLGTGRTWSLPVGDMQVEHGHCMLGTCSLYMVTAYWRHAASTWSPHVGIR